MEHPILTESAQALEELFFALAGLDTNNICVESVDDELRLAIGSQIPRDLILPFEHMIIGIRELFSNSEFTQFISIYLQKLSLLRQTADTVEKLYVALAEDRLVLSDLLMLQKKAETMPGISSIEAVRSAEVKKFLAGKAKAKEEEAVLLWMNDAEPTTLVETNRTDGFGNCFWNDAFSINGLKHLHADERAAILECGKINFLLRKIFNIEIVRDYFKQEENEGTLDVHEKNDIVSQFSGCLNPFQYCDNLIARRNEMNGVLEALILPSVAREINTVYSVLFAMDFSLYTDIFHKFHKDLFSSKNEIIVHINEFVASRAEPPLLFQCLLSNVSFSEYVLRLLKTQKAPQPNPYLTVLERFSVELSPVYLQYFLSQKAFTEIKIINRLLFLISACIYYIERSPSQTFLRAIYLVFMSARNIEIKRASLEEGLSIAGRVELLQKEIARLLGVYSLTCAEVFVHWAELIDICLESIQMDYNECANVRHYNERTKKAVENLKNALLTQTGEDDITELIATFDWDAYF